MEFGEKTRGNGFKIRKKKGRFNLNKEEFLHNKGGEVLKQVALRSCG